MTAEVASQLDEPWTLAPGETTPDQPRSRQAKMRVTLMRWLSGQKVVFDKDLKPMEPPPPYVWAIRANAPKPGSRLFGFMASPGIFVGLALARRDLLEGDEEVDERRVFEVNMRFGATEWLRVIGDASGPLATAYPFNEELFRGLCEHQNNVTR